MIKRLEGTAMSPCAWTAADRRIVRQLRHHAARAPAPELYDHTMDADAPMYQNDL